jgi:hypothetical protein
MQLRGMRDIGTPHYAAASCGLLANQFIDISFEKSPGLLGKFGQFFLFSGFQNAFPLLATNKIVEGLKSM